MPNNSTPFEIIGAPCEVYIAPVGTAFGNVNDDPVAPWASVGTAGADNQTSDGVTINQNQDFNIFRGGKSTGPRKVFRTAEDQTFSLVIADLTLEQWKHALNENAVATVAPDGEAGGYKEIGLSRGTSVATMALLLKTVSPYMDDGAMQLCIPLVAQTGKPQPVFKNGEAVGLALEFTTLEDTTQTATKRFGWVQAQNADAIS